MHGKAQEEGEQEPAIEVLVDPPLEVIRQAGIAPGMGILYRYHPDTNRRLADGFPRFIEGGHGRLVVACAGKNVVGYAVITRPDPQERWGEPSAPELWELGFIEVARGWRQRGIGRKLLVGCFADGVLDNRIVLATAYVWHWDLKGTGLTKDAYRDVVLRCFGSVGFESVDTDEPNVSEDSANTLLVRIGPWVNPGVREEFLALLNPNQDKVPDATDGSAPASKDSAELAGRSIHVWNPHWWLAQWTLALRLMTVQIAKSVKRWFGAFRRRPWMRTLRRPRAL